MVKFHSVSFTFLYLMIKYHEMFFKINDELRILDQPAITLSNSVMCQLYIK